MTRLTGPLLYKARRSSGRGFYNGMPAGRDRDYFQIWDDFLFVANDQTNDWTIVKDAGASVAIVADAVGGQLALTSTTTTDNDGASIQGNEIFKPEVGKDIWFSAYVKASDADQHDMFIGLCENFSTNPENCLTSSNRIGFQIDDESAAILAKSEKTDTETSTSTGEVQVDATFAYFEFHVRGVSAIYYFINGSYVATHTTNIPIVELAPAFFNLSGNNTGTHTATIDYIWGIQTR